MNELLELWQEIIRYPATSITVILNLILIESLLSVDNAAVLATMVMDLPVKQRGRALRYGIWGAYLFRGLALVFAAFLIRIWWLKPLGGIYLIFLVVKWYRGRRTKQKTDNVIDKESNGFYKFIVKMIGPFWATVCLVEVMDMAFSIDNVFAAVAFTKNILLVFVGVFIGIFAMRFIAQYFVSLMERYPFLEVSAFLVIGVLGLKLLLSLVEHFLPAHWFSKILSSHSSDIFISLLTVSIFLLPVISCLLFNVPKRNKNAFQKKLQ